ncbi:MAG: deoxyribodipyrimidine photo-lyase [Acidobacteriota bacterium]|nr:deoxyribodipyrimidine photo-lyase [Acidobacteriota bacterium]
MQTDDPRTTIRRAGPPDPDGRCVVYWMQRAQRAVDNPALDTAVEAGNALGKPVVAFLGLVPFVERANLRHYHFLVEGLEDVAEGLARRGVGFVLRRWPEHGLLAFCAEVRPALVVGDENWLRQPAAWRGKVATRLRVPFWTVDADVVVPTGLLEREQYAARTIRPRLLRQVDRFLVPSAEPKARIPWQQPTSLMSLPVSPAILEGLPIDRSAAPVAGFRGGTREGLRRLRGFIRSRLAAYDRQRNHPETDGTSELSPYLHFGHLGPIQVARAVAAADGTVSATAFLEQLIVRRELAVNFVRYNPHYDTLAGCEDWARATLTKHRRDARPVRYTDAQLEAGETGDPLWNAAQRQMVRTGWMHGYVRMYWAKKLLEWTAAPAHALELAIRLNDRYELDGRDPNGYTNIAWAIGGKHDRAWGPERPIFGTIRYMSFASTSRKFDWRAYARAIDAS